MKRYLIILITAALAFTACNTGTSPDAAAPGDVPKPSLGIPGALTTTNRSRALPGASESGIFEPFRASLDFARETLNGVYGIIDYINSIVVPDSYTGTDGSGNTIVISSDNSRTYSKRIEYTSAGSSDAFLQINYTPGLVKGEIYYTEEDTTKELHRVKLFYDETGTYPVLKGWLAVRSSTINTGDDESDPYTVYFHGTKNSLGQLVFEGGVAYHYVVPADTNASPYALNSKLEEDRTYMYRALADSSGSKAETALYFPLSTNDSTTLDGTVDLQSSLMDILYTYYETTNSQDLDSNEYLGTGGGTISDGPSLETALSSLDLSAIPDNLEFLLKLENTIAYSDMNGYEGNTNGFTPFPAGYNLGDPESISFTLSPSEIAALTESHAVYTLRND